MNRKYKLYTTKGIKILQLLGKARLYLSSTVTTVTLQYSNLVFIISDFRYVLNLNLSESKYVDQINICAKSMKLFSRIATVVKLYLHLLLITTPLLNCQETATIFINWKLFFQVLELKLKFSFVSDNPIRIDLNHTAVVSLLNDLEVERLHTIYQKWLYHFSFPLTYLEIRVQEMILVMNNIFIKLKSNIFCQNMLGKLVYLDLSALRNLNLDLTTKSNK